MGQAQLPLPAAVDGFVTALNTGDAAAMLREFAGDALVNDARCEYRGHGAIGCWIAREAMGASLTVLGFREHYGDVIVTGRMDRTCEQTGLTDPLILTFYFTLRFTAEGDRIVQLIIIRNGPAAVFARRVSLPVKGAESGPVPTWG